MLLSTLIFRCVPLCSHTHTARTHTWNCVCTLAFWRCHASVRANVWQHFVTFTPALEAAPPFECIFTLASARGAPQPSDPLKLFGHDTCTCQHMYLYVCVQVWVCRQVLSKLACSSVICPVLLGCCIRRHTQGGAAPVRVASKVGGSLFKPPSRK